MVPEFLATHGKGAEDEWTLCKNQGANLGPILENHYNTFFTESDIDTFPAVGVNLLRIPSMDRCPWLTSLSWKSTSDSETGRDYAIEKYGMYIMFDLNCLPGRVDWLEIGEAIGHGDWFYSETNLELSCHAVKAVIQFIQSSGHIGSYTLAPVNEAVDSKDLRTFGTDLTLSPKAAEWLLRYFLGTIELVEAVNPNIPVMLQDSFTGEGFWAPQLPQSANVVIDTHHYYFAGRGLDLDKVPAVMVEDAKTVRGTGTFPVLIGEW